jgi:hypothetical protein
MPYSQTAGRGALGGRMSALLAARACSRLVSQPDSLAPSYFGIRNKQLRHS